MILKNIAGEDYNINNCLGCAISNGEAIPFGNILYKDEFFHIEQDFEVPINGFIIISCNKHYSKLTDLPLEAQYKLINLVNKIINILTKHNIAEHFTTLIEERPNYHLHLWILPRHNWMIEKFGNASNHYAEISKYAINNLKTKENLNEILKTCNIIKSELNKK